MSLYHIYSAFSFAMGACIASFLNVVVWRVPRGESIVSPPSHCPKCGAPIRWWQNIPVVSWLALRGKCAKCRAGISPRYILVELLGGKDAEVVHIPRRPGEPDCTWADTAKICRMLGWQPKVTLEAGVQQILENIDYWRKAPVWTPESIRQATEDWFRYLG